MASYERGKVQVTFDCVDPVDLATFWAEVLGYPPPDVERFEQHLRDAGEPEENLGNWSIIADPTGAGPRLFFQKVPEGKVAKNRVHLDVRASMDGPAGPEVVDAVVERLVGLGARKLRSVSDTGGYFVVMQDPEGNEFCID